MNTEEDTFNILRRINPKEIVKLYNKWWMSYPGIPPTPICEEFVNKHGWTLKELRDLEREGKL